MDVGGKTWMVERKEVKTMRMMGMAAVGRRYERGRKPAGSGRV
jgi:hypothetical protein